MTAINATADVLTVVRTKRDSVSRFSTGAWIEVTDDFHELGGVPGEMHQIAAVDDVKLTLTLKTPLNAGQFDLVNPASRNTRVILWDESGTVRDINNNIVVDVDQNGGLIPINQNTTVVLEDGIQVTFSLDPLVAINPQFQLGDYWIFTARVVDASVEILTQTPPRDVHHSYCRLAVVDFPNPPPDCRTLLAAELWRTTASAPPASMLPTITATSSRSRMPSTRSRARAAARSVLVPASMSSARR